MFYTLNTSIYMKLFIFIIYVLFFDEYLCNYVFIYTITQSKMGKSDLPLTVGYCNGCVKYELNNGVSRKFPL